MKLYKELRLQGTHYLYTFIQSEVIKWQSSQSRKSDKLIQGLYPNHMLILQTIEKTCAKFQKDLYKTARRVGLTRHPLSITFIESKVRKWPSSQSGKSDKKFQKIGIELYEELR